MLQTKRTVFNRLLLTSAACLVALLANGQIKTYAEEGETTPPTVLTDIGQPKMSTEVELNEPTLNTEEKTDLKSAMSDVTPTNKHVTPSESQEKPKTQTMDSTQAQDHIALKQETYYMDQLTTFVDTISVGNASTEGMVWTIDGKPVSDLKTWDLKKGGFVGESFAEVSTVAMDGQLTITVNLAKLFGNDLSLRTPSNMRREYRHHMGEHFLTGTNGTITITKVINYRPYESFMLHEEMLEDIEQTRQTAAENRYVTIETIGTSSENREIKMGIISKDETSLSHYLDVVTPNMLTKPAELLTKLQHNELDYKLPILINNTHADEQPGIDIVRELFKEFAKKDTVTFMSTTEDGKEKEVTIDVKALLEKFIFLFSFTENPDGDVNNTRGLANGLDPNRDTGYQANPETKAIVAQINKWNPLSVLDIHGFVKSFLIEPATPPHDPNFEYDLLADVMLEHAHEMGRAGIANSAYTQYIIPKLDWGDGWDDSFSGYTAVYAMYHGILGHTIEIPEMNQQSFRAGFYAALGSIDYLNTNRNRLMEKRLLFYNRGLEKIEDEKAAAELVGPTGEIIGRIKGTQPKFFPDYYVIPMTLDKDNDLQEAFNMIEYFKRNGVVVKELTKDIGAFKKGDLVIDMAQAKRGYANHVLYKGSDESKWAAMYAELVVNFPQMRGFKSNAVFEEAIFKDNLQDVTRKRAPRTIDIDTSAPYYVIANNSASAVKAVNQAIAQGKLVYLTEDGYIVNTETFIELVADYALYGEALNQKPVGKVLKPMKIYSPKHNIGWVGWKTPTDASLAVMQLGFTLVDTPEEADAIVLANLQFDASVFGKKPVIVIGGEAMQRLEALNVIQGFDAEQQSNDYEGLLKAIVDDTHPLASGYSKNGLIYSNSGNWIKGIPEGYKPVVKVANDDFYIAGWWPNHDGLANQVMAIAGEHEGQPIFIYAGNPTNRLHPIHFYRWVSNALFGTTLAELEELPTIKNEQTIETVKPHTTKQHAKPQHTKKTLPKAGMLDTTWSTLSGMLIVVIGGSILALMRKED